MTVDELKSFVDRFADAARRTYERGGYHVPMAILHTARGDLVVGLSGPKDAWAAVIGLLLAKTGATAWLLITEGWLYSDVGGDLDQVMAAAEAGASLADVPGSLEVLQIMGLSASHRYGRFLRLRDSQVVDELSPLLNELEPEPDGTRFDIRPRKANAR
jgi:hypothetical protein